MYEWKAAIIDENVSYNILYLTSDVCLSNKG